MLSQPPIQTASQSSSKIAEVSASELKWRCRRGMLELDLFLSRFVANEQGLKQLKDDERARFYQLLDFPDQELLKSLLAKPLLWIKRSIILQKKSNNVQHFKIQPSKALKYFKALLNLVAFLLIVFCSIEWVFKALLVLLLVVEYHSQQIIAKNENHLTAIQVRDNKLFLMRQNDDQFQSIDSVNIKQNRIFAELELHLKDEVRSEFICQDSFTSKYQFCSLMQHLRFIH